MCKSTLPRRNQPVTIAEVKHWSPYDGCFWHWEYYQVPDDESQPLVPIAAFPVRDWTVKTKLPVYSWQDWDNAKGFETGYRWMTRQELNEALNDDKHYGDTFTHGALYTAEDGVINPAFRDRWQADPTNIMPTFWRFCQAARLTYVWHCDNPHHGGDGMTTAEPIEMSGYTGNGGVGVTASGWYCEDCPSSDSMCWNCDSILDDDGQCQNPDCTESPLYHDESEDDSDDSIDR